MAKRKAARRSKPAGAAKKRTVRTAEKRARKPPRKGLKQAAARPARTRSAKPRRKATARRTANAAKAKAGRKVKRRAARPQQATPAVQAAPARLPRLDRVRRTLDEGIPTPPSSLDMERHGSAARSGRAEMEQSRKLHGNMSDVTGGDVDVNVDTAYFSGDEAPGGDNPTPDMDIVDDIGKALGVEYNDNEELKSGEKLTERDRHRWELDPASAEDYRHRD